MVPDRYIFEDQAPMLPKKDEIDRHISIYCTALEINIDVIDNQHLVDNLHIYIIPLYFSEK